MRFIVSRLPPIFRALLLQGAALLLIPPLAVVTHLPLRGGSLAALCGLMAALLSRLAGLERWWLLIQLLFPMALWFAINRELAAGWYLGALLLLALIYWSTFNSRIPLYLSGRAVWKSLETLLPVAVSEPLPRQLRFVDVGCGIGGLLQYLGERRPDMEFVGIEIAPLPALLARLRAAFGKPRNVRILWGSFWKHDLSDYDVVFAFLSPVPMAELWGKASAELRAGSLFITSSFVVPGVVPEQKVVVQDLRGTRLYVHRIAAPG